MGFLQLNGHVAQKSLDGMQVIDAEGQEKKMLIFFFLFNNGGQKNFEPLEKTVTSNCKL